mgnify:CR=1 FL=1
MRTETRKYEVYKVDELSDKAKENAYWKWLKGFEYDASDNRAGHGYDNGAKALPLG